jgi:glycosyltransferase involved in cell wall biosynthesis
MAQEKRSEVSAVVLTFNNENTIAACLESVKWAGEIVVVDSLSTDKTLDICRRYTDRIWQAPWQGYARQWNFAIDKAEKDWILIVASDEEIPLKLKEEIGSALDTPGDAAGYLVPRKTYFLNKWIRHCGWYPDLSVRLIRAGCGRFDENKLIHESVSVQGVTARLKNPILHHSYSTVGEYIDRMNRYTTLAAEQMIKDAVKMDRGRLQAVAARKALSTFWKMYVKRLGFLDGMRGLFLCVFSGVYRLMTYVKYWEMITDEGAR